MVSRILFLFFLLPCLAGATTEGAPEGRAPTPPPSHGRGIMPFGSGSSSGGESFLTLTPQIGWTKRRSHFSPPLKDPVSSEEPGTLVAGLNLSAHLVWTPMFTTGIGLGVYRDDGAISVDLVPKAATLFGILGIGAGGTWRDGEVGTVVEGWAALLAGIRTRATYVDNVKRLSTTLFIALPLPI